MDESVTFTDEGKKSILKARHRMPLQEVQSFFPDDDGTVTCTMTKNRRVSFGRNQIKEFIVGSAASTQAVLEYDQSSESISDRSECSGPLDLAVNKSMENHAASISDSKPPEERARIFTENCISIAKSVFQDTDAELTAIIIGAKPTSIESSSCMSFTNFDISNRFENFPDQKNNLADVPTEEEQYNPANKSRYDFLNSSVTNAFIRRARLSNRTPLGQLPPAACPWIDEQNENIPPAHSSLRLQQTQMLSQDNTMEFTCANTKRQPINLLLNGKPDMDYSDMEETCANTSGRTMQNTTLWGDNDSDVDDEDDPLKLDGLQENFLDNMTANENPSDNEASIADIQMELANLSVVNVSFMQQLQTLNTTRDHAISEDKPPVSVPISTGQHSPISGTCELGEKSMNISQDSELDPFENNPFSPGHINEIFLSPKQCIDAPLATGSAGDGDDMEFTQCKGLPAQINTLHEILAETEKSSEEKLLALNSVNTIMVEKGQLESEMEFTHCSRLGLYMRKQDNTSPFSQDDMEFTHCVRTAQAIMQEPNAISETSTDDKGFSDTDTEPNPFENNNNSAANPERRNMPTATETGIKLTSKFFVDSNAVPPAEIFSPVENTEKDSEQIALLQQTIVNDISLLKKTGSSELNCNLPPSLKSAENCECAVSLLENFASLENCQDSIMTTNQPNVSSSASEPLTTCSQECPSPDALLLSDVLDVPKPVKASSGDIELTTDKENDINLASAKEVLDIAKEDVAKSSEKLGENGSYMRNQTDLTYSAGKEIQANIRGEESNNEKDNDMNFTPGTKEMSDYPDIESAGAGGGNINGIGNKMDLTLPAEKEIPEYPLLQEASRTGGVMDMTVHAAVDTKEYPKPVEAKAGEGEKNLPLLAAKEIQNSHAPLEANIIEGESNNEKGNNVNLILPIEVVDCTEILDVAGGESSNDQGNKVNFKLPAGKEESCKISENNYEKLIEMDLTVPATEYIQTYSDAIEMNGGDGKYYNDNVNENNTALTTTQKNLDYSQSDRVNSGQPENNKETGEDIDRSALKEGNENPKTIATRNEKEQQLAPTNNRSICQDQEEIPIESGTGRADDDSDIEMDLTRPAPESYEYYSEPLVSSSGQPENNEELSSRGVCPLKKGNKDFSNEPLTEINLSASVDGNTAEKTEDLLIETGILASIIATDSARTSLRDDPKVEPAYINGEASLGIEDSMKSMEISQETMSGLVKTMSDEQHMQAICESTRIFEQRRSIPVDGTYVISCKDTEEATFTSNNKISENTYTINLKRHHSESPCPTERAKRNRASISPRPLQLPENAVTTESGRSGACLALPVDVNSETAMKRLPSDSPLPAQRLSKISRCSQSPLRHDHGDASCIGPLSNETLEVSLVNTTLSSSAENSFSFNRDDSLGIVEITPARCYRSFQAEKTLFSQVSAPPAQLLEENTLTVPQVVVPSLQFEFGHINNNNNPPLVLAADQLKLNTPPCVFQQVVDNLNNRANECDSIWQLELIRNSSEGGSISVYFPLLDSGLVLNIDFQNEQMGTISNILTNHRLGNGFQWPERHQVNEFGFIHLSQYIIKESKKLLHLEQLPCHMDFFNAYAKKVRYMIKDLETVLRGCASCKLSEDTLSLKICSFLPLMSCWVDLQLNDLLLLGQPGISFRQEIGRLDESPILNLINSAQQPILQNLTRSIYKHIDENESKSGYVTRRPPLLY